MMTETPEKQAVDFEQERARLTRKAWGVTVVYGFALLVMTSFVFVGEQGLNAFREMSPNEVGDLLAGVAGPVAFIWLVYGYFLQGVAIRQQSEELRQNTAALKLQEEALRAQAEELKASVKQQQYSVEQQKHMVDISREQLKAVLESSRYAKERDDHAARANFVLAPVSVDPYRVPAEEMLARVGPQKPQYLIRLNLSNHGRVATDIRIHAPEPDRITKLHPKQIPSMRDGSNPVNVELVLRVLASDPDHVRIEIHFVDEKFHARHDAFDLYLDFQESDSLRWVTVGKSRQDVPPTL